MTGWLLCPRMGRFIRDRKIDTMLFAYDNVRGEEDREVIIDGNWILGKGEGGRRAKLILDGERMI